MKRRWIVLLAVALTGQSGVWGQGAPKELPAQAVGMPGGDWPYHGGDPRGTRYSTLSQINVDNVRALKRAWVFRTGHTAGTFETTPLVIDGVMYITAPNGVFAIDAVTGREIWKSAPVGPNGNALGASTRGVEFWPGSGGLAPRLFTRTSNGLTALGMKTGEPVSTFGENGSVPNTGTSTSPPSIYRDVVMIQDNGPNIQAYDARTGRKLWQTELVAQPGDPNQATWLNDSWKTPVGGTDVWGIMSIDPDRGMLFAPVSKAGNDYWGGPHHGNNLYSDSVVAIDAMTGNMVWHYQTVHHDIWDFDLGAAPTLVDVRHNGQLIPAVAQITKMGLLFVLNRETGRAHLRRRGTSRPADEGTRRMDVADAALPAEASAARPYEHDESGACRDWKISPEHEAFCRDLWERNNVADSVPYEPWRTNQAVTVHPGALGGGNWGGVSFHRGTGFIVTNIHNTGQWGILEPQPERAGAAVDVAADVALRERRIRGGRLLRAPAPADLVGHANRVRQAHTRTRPLLERRRSAGLAIRGPWGELVAIELRDGRRRVALRSSAASRS